MSNIKQKLKKYSNNLEPTKKEVESIRGKVFGEDSKINPKWDIFSVKYLAFGIIIFFTLPLLSSTVYLEINQIFGNNSLSPFSSLEQAVPENSEENIIRDDSSNELEQESQSESMLITPESNDLEIPESPSENLMQDGNNEVNEDNLNAGNFSIAKYLRFTIIFWALALIILGLPILIYKKISKR